MMVGSSRYSTPVMLLRLFTIFFTYVLKALLHVQCQVCGAPLAPLQLLKTPHGLNAGNASKGLWQVFERQEHRQQGGTSMAHH